MPSEATTHTLQYHKERGVKISLRLMMRHENCLPFGEHARFQITATKQLSCIGQFIPGRICEPCHQQPVTNSTEDDTSMQSQLS
jgi:hypothetical protein